MRKITLLLSILSLQVSAQCFDKIDGTCWTVSARKADGTFFSWGRNQAGQIGDGTTTNRSTPTQILTAQPWISMSGARSTMFAIKADGTLWAWGENGNGILGINTPEVVPALLPIQIGTDTNWQKLASMSQTYHVLAIKTNGTLWAWGYNEYGQLGDGTTISRSTPIQVGTDTNWTNVAAGGLHTVAQKADGTLWSWGRNDYGELGLGSALGVSVLQPTQIGTDTDWNVLSTGYAHTLAIKNNGTFWGWGNNSGRVFGDGTFTNRNVPVQTGTDTNWLDIVGGDSHTLALKTNGTLWAWGLNIYGQLGDGTTNTRTTPVQIGTDSDWQEIDASLNRSAALKTNGTLYTWGHNSFGEIGDGTFVNRSVPTAITCPTSILGITGLSKKEIHLCPNPVNNALNISYDEIISSVSIYNLLGQEVFTKAFNDYEAQIDVSNFTSGTYIVKVAVAAEVRTMKLIKK
ncbi:MAG TPA: T9SS type A sorting domain-containing protein [Flavobacterium sp.]